MSDSLAIYLQDHLIESTLAPYVATTVHPSSILRAPDENARHEEMARFIADLKKIARVLQ
jgi:uracil-DNA glycosylase